MSAPAANATRQDKWRWTRPPRGNSAAPTTLISEIKAIETGAKAPSTNYGPTFAGWLPNRNSARYNVTESTLPPWTEFPNAKWFTPENPMAAPGTPGGPIYFNWDAGALGTFSLYMGGYLYRKE